MNNSSKSLKKRTVKHSLITLFLSVICIATTCPRGELFPLPTLQYAFQGNVTVSSPTGILAIGDTLWIEWANPRKKLFEKKSAAFLPADSLSIPFYLEYQRLAGGSIPEAFQFITSPTSELELKSEYYGVSGRTGCSTGYQQHFRIGMVCRDTGTYAINFQPTSHYLIAGCLGRKDQSSLSSMEYLFSDNSGSKDIFNSLPMNSQNGYAFLNSQIDKREVYLFQVK
ncbi:MAG TPA: hypothetical protein VHK91_16510 [Flavisolibacter sp.]|jgi:hypothetical protein|nr:hypothetical protein [Flavisolibacter sp.]